MFFSVLSLFALSSMAMERMDSNSAALLPLSLLLILLVLLLLPLFFSANFWRSLTASGLTWYPWLSARVIARLTFEDAEELKGERAGILLFLLAIYLFPAELARATASSKSLRASPSFEDSTYTRTFFSVPEPRSMSQEPFRKQTLVPSILSMRSMRSPYFCFTAELNAW